MAMFNAWGHELTIGELAVSAKRHDVLKLVNARKHHTCNDCLSSIESGSVHGTSQDVFMSRHVCADCLRNKASWDFVKTQHGLSS